MSTPIRFSILTAGDGSTQKRIIPGPDGKPIKDANHKLGINSGYVEPVTVDGLAAFAAALANIACDQAITLGVTGSDRRQNLRTVAKLAEAKPFLSAEKRDKYVSRSLEYFSWPTDSHFPLLFDHDPEPGRPDLTADEFWDALCGAFPELKPAGRVVTVSSSSAIYDKATGECLKPAAGHHTFIAVKGDVERFKEILKARCWLHGDAFFKLGNPNEQTGVAAVLERFLTDIAVFSPERLVYEAGALIAPHATFEQRLPAPLVHDGNYIDLAAIPDLTPAERAIAAANQQAAKRAIKGEQLDSAAKRIRMAQPNLDIGASRVEATKRIAAVASGILSSDHRLYLQDGLTITAGEISPDHDGLQLRDPQEPDYRGGAIVAKIFCDKPGQWTIHSFAHGGCKYRAQIKSTRKGNTAAASIKAAKRKANKDRAREILERALPAAHRETRGDYLPALPELPDGFAGWAIDAGLGCGKTTAIGRDIVAVNRESGSYTVELEPRNSLGQQAAMKHGLPHVHDFANDRESQRQFGALSRDQAGLVLCPNSLIRAARHIPQRFDVVVDEAMATLSEALTGSTLKRKYSDTLSLLFTALRDAERVTISESGLDQPTLDLVERVSGKKLQVIRHHGAVKPWPVTILKGSPNELMGGVYQALDADQNIMFCTTSKTEAHALAIWAEKNKIPYMLVTGDTNESGRFTEFFASPDPVLKREQPRLLIVTQTCQTGLSIEDYHFDQVIGYAPGFPPETIYQMLGRYRQPVPRTVWVPESIQPGRYERPQRSLIISAADQAISQWCGQGFKPAKDAEQSAIDDYLAARGEYIWAMKTIPGEALLMMLQRSGHNVQAVDGAMPFEYLQAIKEERDRCKEELARRRSRDHAAAVIDPDVHTREWVKAKRESDTTYAERCTLRKIQTIEQFPGIDWNSPDVWYQAWFAPRTFEEGDIVSGPVGPGATLWAECGELDEFKAIDQDEAVKLISQRLRTAHLLPTKSAKLAILAPMRPLCEQLLQKGKVTGNCPLVKRLAKLAREVGEQMTYALRITATEKQTDAAIANKILRKFGLSVIRDEKESRKGTSKGKDKRQWVFKVEAPALWQPLVTARLTALKAFKRNGSEVGTDLLKGHITNLSPAKPPDAPPPDKEAPSPWTIGAMVRVSAQSRVGKFLAKIVKLTDDGYAILDGESFCGPVSLSEVTAA